jgi:ribosome-associated heat shock protein Hsp15
MQEGIRIDKWLWAVRVYKTRTQATDACKAGRIKILGTAVKASREVKIGEEISVHVPPVNRILKVTGLTEHRVSAKLVPDFMTDLTPGDEVQKLKLMKAMNFEYRERGLGRPTKRLRREIENLKNYLDQ